MRKNSHNYFYIKYKEGIRMRLLHFIGEYFSERFTPLIRFLHYAVIFLVLTQIVLSNFMEVSHDGAVGNSVVEYYSTWIHILTGLLLVFVVLFFIYIELKKHGFAYFFPYLYGDFEQIKLDFAQLKSFQLPEASPKGFAAVIQGLGLGALFLVVLSGFTWFITWRLESPFAGDVKEIHQLLTGLIEVYVIGHGGMGLVHLFKAFKCKS